MCIAPTNITRKIFKLPRVKRSYLVNRKTSFTIEIYSVYINHLWYWYSTKLRDRQTKPHTKPVDKNPDKHSFYSNSSLTIFVIFVIMLSKHNHNNNSLAHVIIVNGPENSIILINIYLWLNPLSISISSKTEIINMWT